MKTNFTLNMIAEAAMENFEGIDFNGMSFSDAVSEKGSLYDLLNEANEFESLAIYIYSTRDIECEVNDLIDFIKRNDKRICKEMCC